MEMERHNSLMENHYELESETLSLREEIVLMPVGGREILQEVGGNRDADLGNAAEAPPTHFRGTGGARFRPRVRPQAKSKSNYTFFFREICTNPEARIQSDRVDFASRANSDRNRRLGCRFEGVCGAYGLHCSHCVESNYHWYREAANPHNARPHTMSAENDEKQRKEDDNPVLELEAKFDMPGMRHAPRTGSAEARRRSRSAVPGEEALDGKTATSPKEAAVTIKPLDPSTGLFETSSTQQDLAENDPPMFALPADLPSVPPPLPITTDDRVFDASVVKKEEQAVDDAMLLIDPRASVGVADGDPYYGRATPENPAAPPQISAFAKIEFEDGVFYQTTYQVELGRDVRPLDNSGSKHLLRRKRSSNDENVLMAPRQAGGDANSGASNGMGGPLPTNGGIVGPDGHHGSIELPLRTSKSTGSSSRHGSRRASMVAQNEPTTVDPVSIESVDGSVTAPVDESKLGGDPNECPLVPIHDLSGRKSISRRHLRIAYQFKASHFEMEVLGRNGAFHDEQWYPVGERRPLHDGSIIQIGSVKMVFWLPTSLADNSDDGYTETTSHHMSFDFENGTGEGVEVDSSSESAEMPNGQWPLDHGIEGEEDLGEESEESDSDEVEVEATSAPLRRRQNGRDRKPTLRAVEHAASRGHKKSGRRPGQNLHRQPAASALIRKPHKSRVEKSAPRRTNGKTSERPKPRARTGSSEAQPRAHKDVEGVKGDTLHVDLGGEFGMVEIAIKKGPGRPPKDGVMSKRGRNELLKELRAKREGRSLGEVGSTRANGANKAGRASKDDTRGDKRKPEKRAPKDKPNSTGVNGEQSGPNESDAKDSRPNPPRHYKPEIPEPSTNRAQYTDDQLIKPAESYAVTLRDILADHPDGLPLQDMYRALKTRHPYFIFEPTKGWESSVRHNLNQCLCFYKVSDESTEPKRQLWKLDKDVPFTKEARRKRTTDTAPPETSQQAISQAHHGGYAHMPGPGYHQVYSQPGFPAGMRYTTAPPGMHYQATAGPSYPWAYAGIPTRHPSASSPQAPPTRTPTAPNAGQFTRPPSLAGARAGAEAVPTPSTYVSPYTPSTPAATNNTSANDAQFAHPHSTTSASASAPFTTTEATPAAVALSLAALSVPQSTTPPGSPRVRMVSPERPHVEALTPEPESPTGRKRSMSEVTGEESDEKRRREE